MDDDVLNITKNFLLFENLLVFSQSISNVLFIKKGSHKKKLFTCGVHVHSQNIKNKTKGLNKFTRYVSHKINTINKFLLFENLLVFSQSISNTLFIKASGKRKKLFTCGVHVNLQIINTKTKKKSSNKCIRCINHTIDKTNILQSLLFNNIQKYSLSISNILYFSVSSGLKKLFTCGIHVNLQNIDKKVNIKNPCKCGKCVNQIINNTNVLNTLLFNDLQIYSLSVSNILYFSISSGLKKLFTCGQHVNYQRIASKTGHYKNKCGQCNNKMINNYNIIQSLLFNNLSVFSLSISNTLYLSNSSSIKKLFTCGIHVNEQSILHKTDKKNPRKCKKCIIGKHIDNTTILQSLLFNNLYVYSTCISGNIYLSLFSNSKQIFTCGIHISMQHTNHKSQYKNPIGCPSCNFSKLEEKCSYILGNLNIKFISYKRFDECKYKRQLEFDNYLPNHNILIELDGHDHFQGVNRTGKMTKEELEETLKLSKLKDNIKNEFTKNNNIRLLRISYSEINNMKDHIINFINSNELFKFHGIEYTQSNGFS